ncbi:MAG: hypothetical protein KBG80_10135 [Breznakibacter sp.]|nr:hypothetical protein [Breznakibacter sp.]
MYTTYHLSSAQDINSDIIDAIKATFKSKAITIIVEEDNPDNLESSTHLQSTLELRLLEDETTYLTSNESIDKLNKKYGL